MASVDANKITTTGDANFASQQAIVKFILKDKSDNPLKASTLTISAASNMLVKSSGFYTKSHTHSGYTVTAGSGGFSTQDHTNLLDRQYSTKWCQKEGPWYVEFNTASPVQVDGYTLLTGGDNEEYKGRNPKDWELEAKLNSNDRWTTIATVTNDATMEDKNETPYDFVVDDPGTYQYFRIKISSVRDGDILQLGEMNLWEGSYSTAYGDLTVTPVIATSEMTVALRNESERADTYMLTAYVNGTKYTYEKSGVTFQNGKYYEITVKMTSIVTWTASDMTGQHLSIDFSNGDARNNTIKGITVNGSGGTGYWSENNIFVSGGSATITFTSSVGKIKSIVITAKDILLYDTSAGWTQNYSWEEPRTLSWSGTASETVTLSLGELDHIDQISQIVFNLE